MLFIQRRINVSVTLWRCIDVNTTLYNRYVLAGYNCFFFFFFFVFVVVFSTK